MTAVTQDHAFLNEKYTLLCADKCKLLNSIESVSKEAQSIKNEICAILDLIAEFKTDKELEEMDSDSDSEMTMNKIYTSFLNSNIKKKELEKLKRIQSEINDKFQISKKKPKRKSLKKLEIESDNNLIVNDNTKIISQ